MDTVALRSAPYTIPLVLDHIRNLFIRLRWELLVVILLISLYQLTALIDPYYLDRLEPKPFIDGAAGFPGSFLFALLAIYLACRVWADLPSGQRPTFSAYPVSQTRHNAIRITAGAAILLIVFPLAWTVGALTCEIVAPGRSILTVDAYNGWGFIVSYIGFLNAYLFGSILAILFRRPEQWFGLLVLLFLVPPVLVGAGIRLIDIGPSIGFSLLLGPPVGIFSGFGIPFPQIGSSSLLPGLNVVLLWTAILVAGIYASSLIHRDN